MENEESKNPPEPLSYATPDLGRKGWSLGARLAGLFFALLFLALVVSIFLPSQNNSRSASRVKCASNLRQIGQAILLYTNDSKGKYPDTFGDLLLNEDITSSVFICPDSNDTPAVGATTQATVANLLVPGHCSYLYVGKGLFAQTVAPTTVVAYEPPSNHGNSGMNVLFGDGHVEFVGMPAATVILNQVKAGTWPVMLPAAPASAPSTAPSATRK